MNKYLNVLKNESFPPACIVDYGIETESNTWIIFEQLSRKLRTTKQKLTDNQIKETYTAVLNGVTGVYGKNSCMADFKIFSHEATQLTSWMSFNSVSNYLR